MRRAFHFIGAMAFLATAATVSLPPSAFAQGRAAMVGTELVEMREIAETTTVFGQVVADAESTVAARVSGVLDAVMVRPGDRVAQGDPLARFDTELLEIELAQARAEEAVAAAGVEVAEARLDLARSGFERASALNASGSISEGALDDRQGAFAEARAARDQAQAQLMAAHAAISRFEYNLENAVVRAPFDGTILTVSAQTGGYIGSGGAVAVVLDTDAFEVEANVPSRFSEALVPGLVVDGRVDDGAPVKLSMRAVLPTEFAATRTRPVRFTPDRTAGFSVGQSISLALPVSAPEEVLTVPKDALSQSAQGWSVFLNAEGKAEPRIVEVGRALGDRFEVLSGLSPGDEVVVRGNERLRPMQDIQPMPASGDDAPRSASN